jgi:hypothetical protein
MKYKLNLEKYVEKIWIWICNTIFLSYINFILLLVWVGYDWAIFFIKKIKQLILIVLQKNKKNKEKQ